jgi:hypothetical protein
MEAFLQANKTKITNDLYVPILFPIVGATLAVALLAVIAPLAVFMPLFRATARVALPNNENPV